MERERQEQEAFRTMRAAGVRWLVMVAVFVKRYPEDEARRRLRTLHEVEAPDRLSPRQIHRSAI